MISSLVVLAIGAAGVAVTVWLLGRADKRTAKRLPLPDDGAAKDAIAIASDWRAVGNDLRNAASRSRLELPKPNPKRKPDRKKKKARK